MSVKDEPSHWKKAIPEKPPEYQFHGGTVAAIGYLKVLKGRTLAHVLTYNSKTLDSVRRIAKKLANECGGHVVDGKEFCN